MNKKELIKNSPLRVLNPDLNGGGVSQRMGLVMARAGLGKTAILVQIAIDSLLRGNRVLHVSIGQSFEKTKIWYDDVFSHFVTTYALENAALIQQDILRNRFVMTFKETGFNRAKLEERLNDLIYQNIFRPNYLMVDGLDFNRAGREELQNMRELMEAMDMHIWFSAVSHSDDAYACPEGVTSPCNEVIELFDTVILLRPEQNDSCMALDIVKDTTGSIESSKILYLDTATLMLKK